MIRLFYLIGLCAVTLPVWAGENIVLRTGFRLAADRHEVDGATIRIFSGDGVTEMRLDQVSAIELVESPVVEAALPTPPTPVASAESIKPAITGPAPTEATSLTPAELAASAARKYALPSAFVASVMRAESGFNAAAVSPKGAVGLMQLMPDTARGLGVDPNIPADNVDAGTRYLRDLLARYENDPHQVVLALAAYNAGPAAVDKYHGVPPYRETREYILRVWKGWNPLAAEQDSAK
jgi:soluble lytic murein transglycosylase-like protein